jgi:hypothetical protein
LDFGEEVFLGVGWFFVGEDVIVDFDEVFHAGVEGEFGVGGEEGFVEVSF